jgi:hypothetical protein
VSVATHTAVDGGIRIVPLTPEVLMLALACMRGDELTLALHTEAWARKIIAPPSIAYAVLEGGYILGAGGLFQHWPGRGDMWMVVTRFARRRHLALGTRFARRVVDAAQAYADWRRVEVCLPLMAPWRKSFARALGFAGAGQLQEAWGPDGAAYVLYARVVR